MQCLLSVKRGGREKSALAVGGGFTPLSCYWFIYSRPESLPCLLWRMYRKWDPCLCSQGLSASIRNVQTIAGTFSTVCSSSTQIFRLLWKLKLQPFGSMGFFLFALFRGEGEKGNLSADLMMLYSLLHLIYKIITIDIKLLSWLN